MSIETTDYATLDPSLVQQNLDELATRIQEANPTLDLKRGVFRDLLLYYYAVLSSANQTDLQRYQSARSLLAIEADPTLADPGVVDDVLSNFRIERKAGEAATGEVTIVVLTNNTVTISSGAIFEANGKQFAADTVFTGKAEAAQINSVNDRLMTQLTDGTYAFTITVTAVDEGTASVLAKDTLLVPAAPPRGFITAYAARDFVDGRNAETNLELLTRLQQGIACRAPSNRVNMNAMLREIDAFSRVVSTSIVGYGDEEMLRDQHSIFPVSFGGRVDWYVRSQERLLRQALTKEATLVSVEAGGDGIWQFSLGRDEAPGCYEIKVRPLDSPSAVVGTFTITSEARSVDLTGTGFVPDIVNATEGAYSRYQTVTIQFRDTEKEHGTLSIGDKAEYDVEVSMMPLIAEVQDRINQFDLRSYGADVLIKAPVPCFTQLSLTINKQTNEPDPDVEAIKNALAEEVNRVGFIGRLHAGQLHDVVHGFLANNTSLGAIDMHGRIRSPDGTMRFIRSDEILKVPDLPHSMVSDRTVAFFVDPADIAVSVSTDIPTNE